LEEMFILGLGQHPKHIFPLGVIIGDVGNAKRNIHATPNLLFWRRENVLKFKMV